MHFIPGLRLRTSEEAEIVGIDDAEMGEFAYDYVGVDAELLPKQQSYADEPVREIRPAEVERSSVSTPPEVDEKRQPPSAEAA